MKAEQKELGGSRKASKAERAKSGIPHYRVKILMAKVTGDGDNKDSFILNSGASRHMVHENDISSNVYSLSVGVEHFV